MSNEGHRAQRQEEKDQAIEATERALSAIEADNREPDEWEQDQLAQAIGCLFRYAYRLAAVHGELALLPANERSIAARYDSPNHFSLPDLRAAFRVAVAEQLRDYPVLGPVISDP